MGDLEEETGGWLSLEMRAGCGAGTNVGAAYIPGTWYEVYIYINGLLQRGSTVTDKRDDRSGGNRGRSAALTSSGYCEGCRVARIAGNAAVKQRHTGGAHAEKQSGEPASGEEATDARGASGGGRRGANVEGSRRGEVDMDRSGAAEKAEGVRGGREG